MYLISPSLGRMSLDTVMTNIKHYIEEEPEAHYKMIIGSDSQTTHGTTLFVTAFIVQRLGKGSRFFYQKEKHKPIADLRHRIYKETDLSLTFIDHLNQHGIADIISQWPIEVHIDIGHEGETRQLIQEVVGWVTAIGYVAKIKPNSFGASSVADRFTS